MMRLMNRARVAGDRLTSTSTSTHADVLVVHGTSAACRPLHGLNSICAVSTRLKPRLKPGAIDLVPPTAAESLQAPVRGAATHGVERSVAHGVRRECPNSRRASRRARTRASAAPGLASPQHPQPDHGE